MKKLFTFILLLALPALSFAHEGHDNAPGSLKSLHGGVVQAGKNINLETIITGQEINIYPISHEGKDVPLKDVKVEATAKPKKGKPYPVQFSVAKQSFKTTVDLNGANRLPIELKITTGGKTDQFTVQVEE